MTTLTAPLVDRDLTAPDRPAGVSVYIALGDDIRITRAGNIRITRGGNTRIAHNNYYGEVLVLTAPLIDRELTAQERP
jgi:hypothetical protein